MTVSAMTFQPETFQQANPFLTGYQTGQQIYAQGVQNQFAGPLMRQRLLNAQLNNQILGDQAPYAGPQAAATLAYSQAQTPYIQAQTAYTGANANLLRQETPYLVQQQRLGTVKDPLLSRGAEYDYARNSGLISPATLNQILPGSAPVQAPTAGNPPLGGASPPQTLPAAPGNVPLPPQQQKTYNALVSSGALNQLTPNPPGAPQQTLPSPPGTSPTVAGNPNLFGGNATQNFLLSGSPLGFQGQMQLAAYGKGLQQQATTNVDQWNTLQQEAQQAANDAKTSQNTLSQFKNAYDNTLEKGPGLGHLPGVTGNAQLVDSAAANLQLDLAKMQKFQRLTNYDLQIVGRAKPNRAMTPGAVNELYNFLQAKNQQIKEQQDFNLTAKNQGVDPNTARTLWNNYQDQRPVYDFNTKQPFTHLQRTWGDFLTPQAIQAAQAGYPYVPIPTLKNKEQLLAWKNTLSASNKAIVGAQLNNQGGNP